MDPTSNSDTLDMPFLRHDLRWLRPISYGLDWREGIRDGCNVNRTKSQTVYRPRSWALAVLPAAENRIQMARMVAQRHPPREGPTRFQFYAKHFCNLMRRQARSRHIGNHSSSDFVGRQFTVIL